MAFYFKFRQSGRCVDLITHFPRTAFFLGVCGGINNKVPKVFFIRIEPENSKSLGTLYYFSPYIKYTRKIIHSVQCTVGSNFFFFYLTKTANSFYSKINDSSMVRTTAFSSSRFGVRVSVVPNIFTIYP